MSEGSIMSTKGKSTGPDATQIMLQKNDRIREKHVKELRRLGSEAQRSHTDLEKQIYDLQKEIRDIHAYTAVYKDNSLIKIDERREKPSYSDFTAQGAQAKQLPAADKMPSLLKKSKRPSTAAGTGDPFRLKSCLLDVGHEAEEERRLHPKPVPIPDSGEGHKSVKKRTKRSRTAAVSSNRKTGSSEYQSLLPGNCTSYYSIRKYYEQEKDKLLQKWSPEERRKRTVKWILDNIRLPNFTVVSRTTTSAIFRDSSKYKGPSEPPTNPDRLPAIENERDTRRQNVTKPSKTRSKSE